MLFFRLESFFYDANKFGCLQRWIILKAGSCIRNEKLGLRYGKDVDWVSVFGSRSEVDSKD